MNSEQKLLANRAIEEGIEHTTARKIVRYVMECELWAQDTISPSNEYLAEKFGWSLETVKVAISKAKKSLFITTTGYGKARCFELNVAHLKGEMAKTYQKTLRPKADFSDLPGLAANQSANSLANGSANSLANSLANSFEVENGTVEPQNREKGGYNNNNSNKNYNSGGDSSPQSEYFYESPEKTDTRRVKDKLAVFSLFSAKKQPWWAHKQERESALRLFDLKGLEQIRRALSLAHENRDDRYCPTVTRPLKLEEKWDDLLAYKDRHG